MFWGLTRENPDALPSGFIGRPAPSVVELGGFDGAARFGAAELNAKEVKIVNYWASWCVPCRVEHPNITALAELGVPIYGINYKDTIAHGQAFLRELGNPYRAIGRDKGNTAVEWGVYGVPETYVIDGNGIVQLRHAGPVTKRVLHDKILPLIERLRGLP